MFKTILKKIFYNLNLDVRKLTVDSNPAHQLLKCLNYHQIDMVFDVGANSGQFASQLFTVGYKGQIFSYEPLPEAHRQLEKNARNTENWTVYPRISIGESEGNVEINVAANSVSSSVLPMLDAHLDAAKESKYLGKIISQMTTLDNIIEHIQVRDRNFFIKIDTQGYEWQVLNGANHALSMAKGVLCELSLIPLYEGQHLWLEIIDRLNKMGFNLWAIQKGFSNSETGRTLQIDAIFFKE